MSSNALTTPTTRRGTPDAKLLRELLTAVQAAEPSAQEQPGVSQPETEANQPAYQTQAYAGHPQPGPEAPGASRSPSGAAAQPLPHGYAHPQLPQTDAQIHPELRSPHDPAAVVAHTQYAPTPNMMPAGVPPPDQQVAMQGTPAPVAQPAPAPEAAAAAAPADGRKPKRELSQSKRAAQNRAAQRAFRQRKEMYIKKLEQQCKDYEQMEVAFKALQAENCALRDYALQLQNRLLELTGEHPPPPPGLNLSHPPRIDAPQQPGVPQPAGAQPPAPVNNLDAAAAAAAQAVSGLNNTAGPNHRPDQHHLAPAAGSRPAPGAQDPYAAARAAAAAAAAAAADDDARTAAEITRQLQADVATASAGSDGLPAAPMSSKNGSKPRRRTLKNLKPSGEKDSVQQPSSDAHTPQRPRRFTPAVLQSSQDSGSTIAAYNLDERQQHEGLLRIPPWEVSEEMISQNQARGDGARLYWGDKIDWDPDCFAEGRKMKKKKKRKKRKRKRGSDAYS
ncbi:putative sequence-specific DNA binding protein [Thermochaetoides thermophila DSM 1495]|uniref:Putative transcription factor kapC n=1 Tax=Chaetomium thermophilum (strain DSM 1495 / CBS 144.50 / IMI 039719) TaxID=759272 RepID=G0S588_CHATD|nr:putative sequence-specific DNA binding protein [Thermochaetoides thermophila DSM 1495]EGS21407.1 putative sequence-specific DNA binding protein [Thermochaetoides thermophila DSM 1495]